MPTTDDQVDPGTGGEVITYSAASGTTTISGFNASGSNPTVTNQTGGSLSITGTSGGLFYFSSNSGTSSLPNYTISGGSLYIARTMNMTWNNVANAESRFLQTGGSVTTGENIGMAIKNTGQKATYQMQGGTLSTRSIYLGNGGNSYTALFDQTGGDATVSKTIQLAKTGTTLTTSAIYNLGGGTLTIENSVNPFVFSADANVTDYFDFNGGTLNLEGTWDFTSLTGLANADFRVGGVAATSGDLNFEAIDIGGTGFTQITMIPEPSAPALLGGLGLLALLRRRR